MCVFIFVSFEKKKSVHDRMINRSDLAIITHQAWSMYERELHGFFQCFCILSRYANYNHITYSFFYRKEIESKPFWGHSFFSEKLKGSIDSLDK